MSLLRQWISAPFAHRALFRGFVDQEIRGRFAGSMGGLFWTVLAPLANIAIYIFVFSVVLKVRVLAVETGTDQFVVYLLSGLLPWLAFAEAVNRSTTLVLDKAALITKVAFPVQILPHIGVTVPFLLNGVGMLIFLAYLALQGHSHPTWFALPLVLALHMAFTAGLIALISAVSVFIRDLRQIMGVLVFLWFYLTPIIYPVSLVPQAYRHWLLLNPMYPFIELYRKTLLQHTLPEELWLSAAALATVSFALGGWLFMRIKHAFGDVL